jgi:hypothetical protein
MPSISLAVCIHNQANLLARLLKLADGCYDDLVVVHDGPENGGAEPTIHELVVKHGGQFFVGPRSFQQEPHWPFAWSRAQHDWILRLDADEVPSPELTEWLRAFRSAAEPDIEISGYTCIWPLWNGRRIVTNRWPANRIFLLHKQRVRFFGMAEQVPIADSCFESLQLILEHRPNRKSYGFSNLLLRRQAYRWRDVIARSLLGRPTDLTCWRWTSKEWPQIWEEIRERPLRTAIYRLFVWPLSTMRSMWQAERRIIWTAVVPAGIHQCLVALTYWRLRYAKART